VDLFDVVRSCARRWYVFVPLLLIVAAISHHTYSSVKPVYYGNAVIGLTPPNTRVVNAPQGVAVPRNGLLEVGGATFIANMTAISLRESSVVDSVTAAGGSPGYVSKMFPVPATMSQLPLVMIEVTNADPAAVSKTLDLVVVQAEVILRELQEHAQVPADQMVTPFVVSPPSSPEPGMPSRTRSTAAIFLAGAGLTVLLTVVLDVALTRVAARRRWEEPEESGRDGEELAHSGAHSLAHSGTGAYLPEHAAGTTDGARPVT
jgi:hypothetical protein